MFEFWVQTAHHTYHFDQLHVTVGSDDRCAIVLPDVAVKPLHITLQAFAGRLWLEPKNPFGVTFLNYRPLQGATELFNGDVIDIGPWTLVIQAPSLSRRQNEGSQPGVPSPFWAPSALQTMELDPLLVDDSSGTMVVL